MLIFDSAQPIKWIGMVQLHSAWTPHLLSDFAYCWIFASPFCLTCLLLNGWFLFPRRPSGSGAGSVGSVGSLALALAHPQSRFRLQCVSTVRSGWIICKCVVSMLRCCVHSAGVHVCTIVFCDTPAAFLNGAHLPRFHLLLT